MGVHPCHYCLDSGRYNHEENIYSSSSTGDVDLVFTNGHVYRMPDMVLHYIVDHKWLPPAEFVKDVEECDVLQVMTERWQTKGVEAEKPRSIGYLEGDYPKGEVSEVFMNKLLELFDKAAKDYPWAVAPKRKNWRTTHGKQWKI